MGFNLAVLAVTGNNLDTVLRNLDLNRTGQAEDFPDSPISATTLPSGMHAVCYMTRQAAVPQKDQLTKLSKRETVLCLEVSETVMNSSLTAWKNGKELWSVWHDASYQGTDHLETTGPLPEEFESIRQRQMKLQAQQDQELDAAWPVDHVFDIPVDMFVSLGGFRYDETLDFPNPWEILEPLPKKDKKWWQFFSR